MADLNEKTRLPINWVIALLVGCAGFTGTAVGVGMYFGGRDANATALIARVDKLEATVDTISLVDRRLARIEGALEIKVPDAERFPDGK